MMMHIVVFSDAALTSPQDVGHPFTLAPIV